MDDVFGDLKKDEMESRRDIVDERVASVRSYMKSANVLRKQMVRQWGYRVAQRAKERTLAAAASYSKQDVEQAGADSTPSGERARMPYANGMQ